MVNIDANFRRRIDRWLDLRNGLPFPDDSASFVYCSHTLEHLFPEQALDLLVEIRRVMHPTATARVAVPSWNHALRIARGELMSKWPRKFEDPSAQAINYLFCDGQHKYGYSLAILQDFCRKAGFSSFEDVSEEVGLPPHSDIIIEQEPLGSLIVKLRK